MLYVIFDGTTDQTITTVTSMKEVNDWLEKDANYYWQPADQQVLCQLAGSQRSQATGMRVAPARAVPTSQPQPALAGGGGGREMEGRENGNKCDNI